MKNLILLIFPISLIFYSCQKDPVYNRSESTSINQPADEIHNDFNGNFVLFNGKKRPFLPGAAEYVNFSKGNFSFFLSILGSDLLTISNIPLEKGRIYQLGRKESDNRDTLYAAFHFYHLELDEIEDTYRPIPSESWFLVTNYDSTKRVVEGRYELMMEVEKPKWKSSHPDTIQFEHGTFKTKVIEIQ